MSVEKFIDITEKEIKQLLEDLSNTKNNISQRVILNAINDRKYSIEKVKMEHLNLEITDKYVCMECDEEMTNVTASDEIKKMHRVGEYGVRVIYLMCKECAMHNQW